MLSVKYKRPQRRCCDQHLVNKQDNKWQPVRKQQCLQMFLLAVHYAKKRGIGVLESRKSFQVSLAQRLAWKITNEMLCDFSIVLLDNAGNKWRLLMDYPVSQIFSLDKDLTNLKCLSRVSGLKSVLQLYSDTTIRNQTLQHELKFDTVIYKINITENST